MQIQILSGGPPRMQKRQEIYAIHGPHAGTELGMLAAVRDMATGISAPLRTAMLMPPGQDAQPDLVPVTLQAVRDTCAAYTLNDDQSLALQQIAPWFDNSAASEVGHSHASFRCPAIDTWTTQPLCILQPMC